MEMTKVFLGGLSLLRGWLCSGAIALFDGIGKNGVDVALAKVFLGGLSLLRGRLCSGAIALFDGSGKNSADVVLTNVTNVTEVFGEHALTTILSQQRV